MNIHNSSRLQHPRYLDRESSTASEPQGVEVTINQKLPEVNRILSPKREAMRLMSPNIGDFDVLDEILQTSKYMPK